MTNAIHESSAPRVVAECWTCGHCPDGRHGLNSRCQAAEHFKPLRLVETTFASGLFKYVDDCRAAGHDVREVKAVIHFAVYYITRYGRAGSVFSGSTPQAVSASLESSRHAHKTKDGCGLVGYQETESFQTAVNLASEWERGGK